MQPEAQLVEFFERNSYMRVPNEKRLEEETYKEYKKGWEIRLVVKTQEETAMIRQLLQQVGLKGGKPFRKHSRWVQPIYGKKAMEQFKAWQETFTDV